MKIAILFHGDADGFGSAYAAWLALNRPENDLMFKAVQYGEEPPFKELMEFKAEKVYVLDFCYKADMLGDLLYLVPDTMVIDHHQTSASILQSVYGDTGQFMHNTKYAGCVLTWLHFFPGSDVPPILQYVQDRDLWLFYLEQSKAVNAYIATMPREFEVWAAFRLDVAILIGGALLEYQQRQIERRLKDVRLVEVWEDDGYAFKSSVLGVWTSSSEAIISPADCKKYQIPIVNATENISELGEAMCKAYPDAPFSVSDADRGNGMRSYSLRSTGFDVSEVAKAFEGGGHQRAAGFTLKAPEVI